MKAGLGIVLVMGLATCGVHAAEKPTRPTTCGVHAAEKPTRPMQLYEQIQAARDRADALVDPAHPDLGKLERAETILRDARRFTETPEVKQLVEGNVYLASRRGNIDFDLAGVLALQGRKQAAMDALDDVLSQYWYGRMLEFVEKNPAFASLRGETRFEAFLQTLRVNNRLWADAAFGLPADLVPDQAHRLAGLSLFWSQAKYNFVYFDQVPSLDWDQTFLDFVPKVVAARTLHDYYDVLMRLAPLLHDAHTNVYPPASIQDEFYARPALRSGLVEGHVLVLSVNSPSVAQAGIAVGDEILAVDGVEVHRYARERVDPYISSSTPQDRDVRRYTYQLLSGDHRQAVTLTLRQASGKTYDAALSREPDPAAHRPPTFQLRRLKDGVVYMSLDKFEDGKAVQAFERAWPTIKKAKALMLDLRHNGGGSDRPGLEILSYLSTRPVPTAHATSRIYSSAAHASGHTSMIWQPLPDTDRPFMKEHRDHFDGPVALLIGPRTFSAAEDFVMSFKAMQRGLLVGEATGGSTGNPLQFDLPGGGTARICAKRDAFPDGRSFIGRGIPADLSVALAVDDVRAGRDPVVAAALAALKKLSP